jgi:hypothetical protein
VIVNGTIVKFTATIPLALSRGATETDVEIVATVYPGDPGGLHAPPEGPVVEIESVVSLDDDQDVSDYVSDDGMADLEERALERLARDEDDRANGNEDEDDDDEPNVWPKFIGGEW